MPTTGCAAVVLSSSLIKIYLVKVYHSVDTMRTLEACSLSPPLLQCSSLQATKLRVLDSSPHGGLMMRGSTVRIEVADEQQLACAHLNTRPAPAQGLETVRDAQDGGFLELLFQHPLKQHFGCLIESRSGLVECKQSGLLQQHTRQAHLCEL